MRTWAIALSTVALLAAGCGSDEVTTPTAAPAATSSTSADIDVTAVEPRPTPEASATSTAAPRTTPSTPGSTLATSSTTTSTTSTTLSDAVEPRPSEPVVLSPSGIGPHPFGTARNVLEPWITAELGPPHIEEDSQHQVYDCNRWGCTLGVVMFWPEAGLRVGFADSTGSGVVAREAVLATWAVSTGDWWPGMVSIPAGSSARLSLPPIRLSTASGIGLGSTVTELNAAYPSAEFLAWNDSTFVPNGFYVPDGQLESSPLEGDLDWPSVVDIQTALNAGGANLVVDGVAGPLTRAALEEYRQTQQLADWTDVFALLGLSSPTPTATVVRLSAGQWWWELECGALEAAGITNDC